MPHEMPYELQRVQRPTKLHQHTTLETYCSSAAWMLLLYKPQLLLHHPRLAHPSESFDQGCMH